MMDKQYAIAVMTIILGFGVNQAGNSDAFLNGLGIGIIGMGLVWVAIRLIKELKKNEVKISRNKKYYELARGIKSCQEKATLRLESNQR